MRKLGLQNRIFTLLLALALLLPAIPQASAAPSVSLSKQSVYWGGSLTSVSSYLIDGSNYFMLRDLAKLLNGSAAQFSISTNIDTYTIQITTGKSYTARGGELSALPASVSSVSQSKWKLVVDGKQVSVSAYLIDGSNFFKLRDLSAAIGFGVTYDSEAKAVNLYAFNAEPATHAAVSGSWFDDAIFVGDSVSTWLAWYTGDSGLGDATVFTATSFGVEQALKDVTSSSKHPSYQGVKMKVEDAVVKCGAKKVFLMLGLNDIGYGVDKATSDYVTLIRKILEKSPNAQIYVQSVTPLLSGSATASSYLNNTTIAQFNSIMRTYCYQNGWYYMDIASVYTDSAGNLKSSVCSDPTVMGLHITFAATADWVNYLRTHVPG